MSALREEGGGVLNTLINSLPVELHIPGYQYCGPGTKLHKRLARGDPGINQLDRACKEHDIAYSQSRDLNRRHEADRILEDRAWSRVKSGSSGIGEKAAAWVVTNAMKAKRKLGMGLKKHRGSVSFRGAIVNNVKRALKKIKKIDLKSGAALALSAAKVCVKSSGGKKRVRVPRIIPIPKTGGLLPLLPLLGALGAIGSLAGGSAAIAQAVNKVKTAQKQLEESKRHNKEMETIALGKKGSGLYLKPHRSGLGLYLKPSKAKNY